MSKAFWQGHSIKPPKPGLVKRQQELSEAIQHNKETPAAIEGGGPFSGQSAEKTSAESNVRRAARALKRQQDVQ